jgi:hypothetical protein
VSTYSDKIAQALTGLVFVVYVYFKLIVSRFRVPGSKVRTDEYGIYYG